MAAIARQVRVTGHVQGVFFRAWTREKAGALGIVGWVKNCPDGGVEAHLEGDKAAVDQMVEAMRRGPSGARVDELSTMDAEPCDFNAFVVRR